jgi:hypothetical protein
MEMCDSFGPNHQSTPVPYVNPAFLAANNLDRDPVPSMADSTRMAARYSHR